MSDEYTTPPAPQGPPAAPAYQQGYPTAPPAGYQQGYQQFAPVDPGKTMGIVGFVLAFVFALAGLIVSIIARNKSKAAGFSNGLATAGIWLSAAFLALNVISLFVILPAMLHAANV